MLVNEQCVAYTKALETLGRKLPPPPLGACMIPIVDEYLTLIGPGMRVLDVGCGSWNRIKSHCQAVDASYEGIDVSSEYFGRKTVATRLENLAELSYPDGEFDRVIGNQSMEHWAEYGCTLRWGLHQCFRVLKDGGQLLLNVPIHFHGTREFMLGHLETLRELLRPFSDTVTFEKWGTPPDPLLSFYPYPGYWKLRQRPAYVLDIRAVKNRDLPPGYNNHGAARGRRAQLRNYPFSYNVYRVLGKLGLMGNRLTSGPEST